MENFTYYQVLIIIFASFILFIIAKVGGAYLQELVKNLFKDKPLHGTEEACGNCPALLSYKQDLPLIKKKQEDRDLVLNDFHKSITEVKTTMTSLDGRVKKLFELIEADWKNEITELRSVVREKSAEIERLKHKKTSE